MPISKMTADDVAALERTVKARGRARKYDIDALKEWDVYELLPDLEGAALLSAVKAVIAAGKRRGWVMYRTGTHRLVRTGKPGTRPDPRPASEVF